MSQFLHRKCVKHLSPEVSSVLSLVLLASPVIYTPLRIELVPEIVNRASTIMRVDIKFHSLSSSMNLLGLEFHPIVLSFQIVENLLKVRLHSLLLLSFLLELNLKFGIFLLGLFILQVVRIWAVFTQLHLLLIPASQLFYLVLALEFLRCYLFPKGRLFMLIYPVVHFVNHTSQLGYFITHLFFFAHKHFLHHIDLLGLLLQSVLALVVFIFPFLDFSLLV